MKKKLLIPILTIATTCTCVLPLVACGNNETPEQEASHVKETHATPVVGNDLVINYTLDKGYSLDIYNSKVSFTDSNNKTTEVYVKDCTIDTDAHKVTVPGTSVASTNASVSFKSLKPIDKPEEKKHDVLTKLLTDVSKNYTLEGTEYHVSTSQPEPLIQNMKILMDGHSFQKQTDDGVEYFISQNNEPGWWFIVDQTNGVPMNQYPFWIIFEAAFDPSEVINQAKYNSEIDTFKYNGTSGTNQLEFDFSIGKDKDLKSLKMIFKDVGGAFTTKFDFAVVNKGTTKIMPPTFTKANYVDTFTLADDKLTASDTNPIARFDLTTSNYPTWFEDNKKIHILTDAIFTKSPEHLIQLFNNNVELKAKSTKEGTDGQYYIGLDENKKLFIDIDKNVLSSTSKLIVYPTLYSDVTIKSIEITKID